MIWDYFMKIKMFDQNVQVQPQHVGVFFSQYSTVIMLNDRDIIKSGSELYRLLVKSLQLYIRHVSASSPLEEGQLQVRTDTAGSSYSSGGEPAEKQVQSIILSKRAGDKLGVCVVICLHTPAVTRLTDNNWDPSSICSQDCCVRLVFPACLRAQKCNSITARTDGELHNYY